MFGPTVIISLVGCHVLQESRWVAPRRAHLNAGHLEQQQAVHVVWAPSRGTALHRVWVWVRGTVGTAGMHLRALFPSAPWLLFTFFDVREGTCKPLPHTGRFTARAPTSSSMLLRLLVLGCGCCCCDHLRMSALRPTSRESAVAVSFVWHDSHQACRGRRREAEGRVETVDVCLIVHGPRGLPNRGGMRVQW